MSTETTLNPIAIFGPVLAMFALVLAVAALMLCERIRQSRAQKLDPQQVATRAQLATAFKDSRCADNFANLFETPVLFYVVCIGLFVTHTVSALLLALAWIYVLFRVAHSVIHCGSNRVMSRFKFFAGSMTALSALWIGWGVTLLQK
jgi:hypothetical protein